MNVVINDRKTTKNDKIVEEIVKIIWKYLPTSKISLELVKMA